MEKVRKRLTYANVMSTLAVFLLLGGASAIAAKQLGKNTVGSKQLKKNSVTKSEIKKNAVTAAKLKKNAVTTAKLKNGAVTTAKIGNNAVNGTKIADGSVTGAEIDEAATTFGRVVHQMSGSGAVAVPKDGVAELPLANAVYTQPAGRSDSFIGAVDITFEPGCKTPRSASAYLVVDPAGPASELDEGDIASLGFAEADEGGQVSRRINLSPFYANGVLFRPAAPVNHTVQILVGSDCDENTEGVTVNSAVVDVLGIG